MLDSFSFYLQSVTAYGLMALISPITFRCVLMHLLICLMNTLSVPNITTYTNTHNFSLQCCEHGQTNPTYMVVCCGVCEPRDLAQWTGNNDCHTWCCNVSKSQTSRGSR
jgi:hypothetical protein